MLAIIDVVIGGLSKLVAPLLAYFKGRSDEKNSMLERDVDTLKKQRDNNVYDIKSADNYWLRKRNKRK